MPRHETPLDALRVLEALTAHQVDYLLIGGLAVQAHGHTRTTQDIDILPAPGRANLERLAAALRALGARAAGAAGGSEALRLDADSIGASGTLALDTDAGGVDIHLDPPGAARYADMHRRALELEVLGVRVAVVDRDDLIAMKRAAGRPLDRGDVIALTEPEG